MTNEEWQARKVSETKIIKTVLNSGLEMIQQECFPNIYGTDRQQAKNRTEQILAVIAKVVGNLVGTASRYVLEDCDNFAVQTERMVANIWADDGRFFLKKLEELELGEFSPEQLGCWFDGPNVDKSAGKLLEFTGLTVD